MKTAILWGLGIGVVNMIWLFAAYYLGLHTSGIWVFQVFMLIWFVLWRTTPRHRRSPRW